MTQTPTGTISDSAAARQYLVDALRIDLIGPRAGGYTPPRRAPAPGPIEVVPDRIPSADQRPTRAEGPGH